MGITIESYRINIGIFNNRPPKKHKTFTKSNTNFTFKFNKNLKTCLLILIFFTITQSNNFSVALQNNNNKLSHISNGNIKLTNIKITHFNKGNSKFDNKIDDIHYIIDTHKPLIFSISEVNYCNINKTVIDGYNIEACDFKIGYHTSRHTFST